MPVIRTKLPGHIYHGAGIILPYIQKPVRKHERYDIRIPALPADTDVCQVKLFPKNLVALPEP